MSRTASTLPGSCSHIILENISVIYGNQAEFSLYSTMPTIKDFGSFRISMYFEDHNPPHVHVIGPGFYALVAIADAQILRGVIPARHRKRTLKWMTENRQTLFELWGQYQ